MTVNHDVVGSSPTCGVKFYIAALAQQVERIHGKDEVAGSSPASGLSRSIVRYFFLFARYIIYDILGNRKRAISCETALSESLIFLSSIRLRCLVISLSRLDLQVAQVG